MQDLLADKVLKVRGVKSRGGKWKHYYLSNNDEKKVFETTATPMTSAQADVGCANRGYGQSDLYSQNCQSAVFVQEPRLRRLYITALPYIASTSSIQYKLGENTAIAWRTAKGKTPAVTKLTEGTDEDLFRELDKQIKSAGLYHVGINLIGGQGHIIAAEKMTNGKLSFYDARSGKFLNIRECAAIENLEALKVDKLLINADVIKAIAKRF